MEQNCDCVRAEVFAASCDCESSQKSTLTSIADTLKEGSIDPRFALLVPIPDPTHLAKNVRSNMFNWRLRLSGCTIDLYHMLMALIDRQDVASVRQVASMHEQVQKEPLIVTTGVPEFLRPTPGNLPSDVGMVVDVAVGPDNSLYIVNERQLLRADNHVPMRLTEVTVPEQPPVAVAYANGVVFVADSANVDSAPEDCVLNADDRWQLCLSESQWMRLCGNPGIAATAVDEVGMDNDNDEDNDDEAEEVAAEAPMVRRSGQKATRRWTVHSLNGKIARQL